MTKNNNDPLSQIVFISLPEDINRDIGNFHIDPSILIPVEKRENIDTWDMHDLSWEMILSGMLKVLAYQPDHEDGEYYRDFIFSVKPDIVHELNESALIKANNQDFDMAEELFKVVAGLRPDSSVSFLNLALLFENRADNYKKLEKEALCDEYTEKTFEAYRQALLTDEPVSDAYYFAGLFNLKNHNYERAKGYLNAYINIGDDEERIEEAKNIINNFESQVQLDSLFKEAYDFIQMGQEEEGIQRISEFLEKSPRTWNAWFMLGWGNRRLGKYEEARDAFLKAKELGEGGVDLLNELSICYMELGDLQASYKELVAALRIEPENTKIISNLGILSLKKGDDEEAKAFFRTVLDIDPEDPVANQYIDFIDE